MGAGEGLIATAIASSPIGAASAIASGWIAWIARAVECGIIAAQPTGDDPALGRGIIAPVGQEAVATLAVSAVTPARAQRGVAAGVAAGLIGGAIIGGALAGPGYYGYGPGYYYGPGYGYYGGPAYVADDYCVWQRQRFWDGYGWRVRRMRVCG